MANVPDACRIQWSSALRVTAAEGDCEGVLARGPTELVGQRLSDVLGVPEKRARALDHKAHHESGSVEFLSARPRGEEGTVLRFSLGARDGEAFGWVMDMHALVEGAPPLQISRLASALSHEIRNPLSSVKMSVQTLQRNSELSDRDRRRLAIANKEIRTMERMLGLLSEYGRELAPHFEQVTLRALLHDALAQHVLPELQERDIRVELDEPEEVLRVTVDVHRLRLVLAQLFLNVAMGLPQGAVIPVALARAPDGGALVRLVDPSTHLPPDEHSTVFEPFSSRLHHDSATFRTPGLSLAALRRVLQTQGGDVSIEPNGDRGAIFTLFFPA